MKKPERGDSIVGLSGALLLGFSLSGCLFPAEQNPVDITPLAVGNQWVYVDSVYFPRDSGDDSVWVSTGQTSIIGTRKVTVEGVRRTVYLSNNHDVGGEPSDYSIFVASIGGSNYNFGAQQGSAVVLGKGLHVQYPTRTGNRYQAFFFGFGLDGVVVVPRPDTLDMEVVDANRSCATPAGNFLCVQYRGYYTNGELFADAYYAPGVGHLGSEIVRTQLVGDSLREVRYIRRLTSYTLN